MFYYDKERIVKEDEGNQFGLTVALSFCNMRQQRYNVVFQRFGVALVIESTAGPAGK
ncbi:hypothetical protein D3C74_80650 [compost metagenome]